MVSDERESERELAFYREREKGTRNRRWVPESSDLALAGGPRGSLASVSFKMT